MTPTPYLAARLTFGVQGHVVEPVATVSEEKADDDDGDDEEARADADDKIRATTGRHTRDSV